MSLFLMDVLFIAGLMGVGMWLESIKSSGGFFDEFLTPFPLGFAGVLIVIERAWT